MSVSALLLAGCDSGAPKGGQAAQDASPKAAADAATETFESEGGLVAQLTRAGKGQPAPTGTFLDPSGQPATMAKFKGRPVLVNLWATWCAPCKAEMPTLARLAERDGAKLSVVALAQDNGGQDVPRAWLKEAKLDTQLQAWADPDNKILLALGGSIALPTTVLYDAEGKEVWRMIGPVHWDDAEIAKLLAEAG